MPTHRFQPVSLLPPLYETKLEGWPSRTYQTKSAGLRPPPWSTKHVAPADLEVKAEARVREAEAKALEFIRRNASDCCLPESEVKAARAAFAGSEAARKYGNSDEFMMAALNLWRARQPSLGAPPGPAPSPDAVFMFMSLSDLHGQAEAEDQMGGIA